MDLKTYFLLFIIYSFIGWLIEVLYSLKSDGFVNRGFLLGPYCPIYGFGCLAILILLKDYADHPVTLFINAIVICSVLEYSTSFLLEKIFKVRWWDYSNRKYNLNGRICLETMIPFGLAALFVWYVLNHFILFGLNMIPDTVLLVISIVLAVIFFVDIIISFNIVNQYKNTIKKIKISDATEDINKYIKKILADKSYFYRRLIKAFPKIDLKILLSKLKIDITNKKN